MLFFSPLFYSFMFNIFTYYYKIMLIFFRKNYTFYTCERSETITKSMATLSLYVRMYIHVRTCVLVREWALTRNAQTSGQQVKDQRSLKSPRKRLISYLTLSGKIAATAMDKELNTRQDDLLVPLGRTKLQLTGSFWITTVLRFSILLPLSTPGPNGQKIEYTQRTNVTGSMNWLNELAQ